MQNLIFYSVRHKKDFHLLLERMRSTDPYHMAVAYLLALDTVLRDHTEAIFDFQKDVIRIEGLSEGFQTGTSAKTTRLAFNLWNGCYDDGEEYTDKEGYKVPLPSQYFTPEQIFSCTEYAPYYWQAIQLRYPEIQFTIRRT